MVDFVFKEIDELTLVVESGGILGSRVKLAPVSGFLYLPDLNGALDHGKVECST